MDHGLMAALTDGTIPTCNADDILPAKSSPSKGASGIELRLPVELDFQVKCGYYKHLWLTASGAQQHQQKLRAVECLAAVADSIDNAGWDQYGCNGQLLYVPHSSAGLGIVRNGKDDGVDVSRRKARGQLRWTVHLRLARWMLDVHEGMFT